jgi:hypothetical protein
MNTQVRGLIATAFVTPIVSWGGGMDNSILSRLTDRCGKVSGHDFNEAVLLSPGSTCRYWWIRYLANGEIVQSERFDSADSASSRWSDVKRSYVGGAA